MALLHRNIAVLLTSLGHLSVLLLFNDMDWSQSTVTNVDSGNGGGLPPHCQLCLVFFCKNPRRLHAHQLAFLESTPLASFSSLFVDFAVLCPGTVQNWTVTVHSSPAGWKLLKSMHCMI
jgi:hypothetical protein